MSLILYMEEDFSQVNKFTTKLKPKTKSKKTGVENELRRFAENAYLKTRDPKKLIGTQMVVDEDIPVDDLLLTNAVSENTVQDDLDKTRYLKEAKSYVTINSASRVTQSTTIMTSPSIFTTGNQNYYPLTDGTNVVLQPYLLVVDADGDPIQKDGEFFVTLSADNNHIQFLLQDWTNLNAVTQIINPKSTDTFDVFLPSKGTFTLTQLQAILETNINAVVLTGSPLDHMDKSKNMFTITVKGIATLDRPVIRLTPQTNFRYQITFFSYGFIETAPIAQPIPASDASYVVQDPNVGTDGTFTTTVSTIYPYPNSYALNLNKSYNFVKAIRVVSSEMPNSDTIINTTNHHITFYLINQTLPTPTDLDPYTQNIKTTNGLINWEVYLPAGNYTLTQLVDQMESQINGMLLGEAELSNIFTITANNVTSVFEITVNDPYAFKWDFNAVSELQWRNLYYMLGFRDSSTPLYTTKFTNVINTDVGTYVNSAPYRVIMLRKSDVIWLQLNNYETIYDTYTKCHYFCKFNLDNVKDGQYAYDTFTPSVHVFLDSPIPVLSRVDCRLYDELGNPYNFNGVDHSLTLEIVHHIDRLMGVDISSRRGINDKSSYV